MLSQLTIHNFGLIDRLSIEPDSGLNVFTGETGAGKSILIDALRVALGTKLNTSQIRDPQKTCTIEAVFELTPEFCSSYPLLSEHIDEDNVLIIQRTYTPDGRTRNKVNDLSVTVSRLREIGDHLVDLHGPHDHQMLFSEDSHIGILDRLAGIEKEKAAYAEKFNSYHDLTKKLDDIKELSESRERELDIISHQVKELEQVPLEDEKYEETLSENARINNSERLYECVQGLISILDNEDTGISYNISRAFYHMNTLNGIDESTNELAELLDRIQEDSTELSSALNSYMDSLSFEPGTAEETSKTTDIYTELLRKYGPELEDVRTFYSSIREKYDLLIDLEHNSGEIEKELAAARSKTKEAADKLTSKRKTAAKSLKNTIEKELKELGISNVRFDCRIENKDLYSLGQDKVIFYISPNMGEDLKPLAEIASSGEAARVMLALKKALTKVDPIPVLIFDEIDAQIGGRLGSITGKKLKELSMGRQVLLITHLPQIASFGDMHFKVVKTASGGKTSTEVSLIDEDARVQELAQMMSGSEESAISIEHAKDMLSKASG